MKPVQLILAPVADEGWRTLDVETAPARWPRRILVIPGALVLAREVEAQGRTEAQAKAAALAALTRHLASAADANICALGPPLNGKRTAYIAARAVIASLLTSARARGYAPDAVTPDFALLPSPSSGGATVVMSSDCLVRTTSGGFACQPDMLDLMLEGLEPNIVTFEAAISQRARDKGEPPPDLTPAAGNAERQPVSHALRIACGAAVAALTVFCTLPWIEAHQLDASTEMLRQEILTTAQKALPEGTRVVNALGQLREFDMPRSQAADALDQATVMIEGLARSPGVAVARLELDTDTVRAHVGVSSTSLLQPLRDHIASHGLQLVETPGLSQPNNIPVQLELADTP